MSRTGAWLHPESLSFDDVIGKFHVESLSSSINPFLSPQPQLVEVPPAYDTHHSSMCNLVSSCNSETLASSALSNPPLMVTFCDSSPPNDDQLWSRSPRSAPVDKRYRKLIERQRRKDMNALFAMLRSLLPHEHLRGKRAVSDQVQAAVNYIRHLQHKVEELSTEREKLRANSDKNAKVALEAARLSSSEKVCNKAPAIEGSDQELPVVKIKSMGSVVQVCTNTFVHQIVYSQLLLALEESGLEVLCAASSAIDNKVYHTIHTKVSDLETFRIDTLEKRLWNLIRTNHRKYQNLKNVEAARA